MESLTLNYIQKVEGAINLPGSKSLSNRALLLAALSEGTTEISNLLVSDDIHHMLTALKALGISYQLLDDSTRCIIEGSLKSFSSDKNLEFFLGNAGTAMRPLCAALCLGKGTFTLTGEPRMEERPINSLVDSLRQAGCKISYLKNEGFPPVRIEANGIKGGKIQVDGTISSQFLTALLMIAPLAQEDLEIEIIGELVSKPYIDITLHTMQQFGVTVQNIEYRTFKISPSFYTAPKHFLVEGDASSASYFLSAAAIKGGRVQVSGINKHSIQGDIQFAKVLEQMGAFVEWGDDFIAVSNSNKLQAVDLDLNHIPDAAMTIATTALFAKGKTTIRNIYNWRVKETDRLSAMSTELRKIGATVTEGEDFIEITPPKKIKHAAIDTYNDHRMAMCFSLIALSPCGVTINDPKCTTKTFPDYFEKLNNISI